MAGAGDSGSSGAGHPWCLANSTRPEYQTEEGPYALPRPVGGGCGWEADPERIRFATQAERLSAGVKAANSRAGWKP